MVPDYKHASKTGDKQAALPGWAWFATGLFMGFFCAFLVFLQGQDTSEVAPDEGLAALANNSVVCNDTTPELADKSSRFEFYSTLPERKVRTVEHDSDAGLAVKHGVLGDFGHVNTSQVAKHGVGGFLLQAGSFRQYADADKRKASLALLGVASKIHKVVIEHNQTWHRVHIGPYASKGLAEKTRVLLQREKIETLLVRVKG